mmetsp:Transcript_58688/g.96904  ORF Transcript_58688/g.96904 Transcript_58688/m.96904 type:complete len:219 (-) Transcript_58688:151-807(-)
MCMSASFPPPRVPLAACVKALFARCRPSAVLCAEHAADAKAESCAFPSEYQARLEVGAIRTASFASATLSKSHSFEPPQAELLTRSSIDKWQSDSQLRLASRAPTKQPHAASRSPLSQNSSPSTFQPSTSEGSSLTALASSRSASCDARPSATPTDATLPRRYHSCAWQLPTPSFAATASHASISSSALSRAARICTMCISAVLCSMSCSAYAESTAI